MRIVWRITADPKPRFSIAWLEAGGPTVAATGRNGVGQIVSGRMAEAAVQGIAAITYEPGGLSWNLTAPLERVLTSTQVGPR